MRLKFTASKWMPEYDGGRVKFKDGEIKEVESSEAERLLRKFHANFEALTDTAAGNAPDDMMQYKAPANTAVKGSRKRRG